MCFQRARKHILNQVFCNLCMVELFPCPYRVSWWSMKIHILYILFKLENPRFFRKHETIWILHSNRLWYSISKGATQTLFLALFLGYWEMLLGLAACLLTIGTSPFHCGNSQVTIYIITPKQGMHYHSLPPSPSKWGGRQKHWFQKLR